MKMKWIIPVAVCLVALGIVAAIVCWFICPGVRFAGTLANFNLKEETCFIISGDKVVDRTTMTMAGLCRHSEVPTDHQCDFVIKNYTDVVAGDVCSDFGVIKVQDRWCASYSAYENQDADAILSAEEEKSVVIVQIDFVDNKPVAKINYGTMYQRDDVWAVCADSEEEALELFREFREQ